MSYLIPPEGATDEEVEKFIDSLRNEAQSRVRKMIAEGASEDEILDYLNSMESVVDEAAIDTSPSPQA